MLDLTTIPVVDNHCHPVLLNQHMDALQFRSYCTEANDASFAEVHVPHTVYYLWLLRQMATVYGCERNEEDILATRNRLGLRCSRIRNRYCSVIPVSKISSTTMTVFPSMLASRSFVSLTCPDERVSFP